MRMNLLGNLACSGLVLACLGAAATPGGAQTRIARNQTFERRGEPGQEIRVFTYVRFHRDCQPDLPPGIVVRTGPAHGTVSIQPRPSTVTVVREGGVDCTGRTYSGMAVLYTPAIGFHGTDRFEWDVMNGSTTAHDSAIVDVR